MDILDYIHELFSQDCAIPTVLSLVMKEYHVSQDEAQKNIDTYFEIVEEMDRQ